MRIDAAQVRAGEHIGRLLRVCLGNAKMQEHARAEFAQGSDTKSPSVHFRHVPLRVLQFENTNVMVDFSQI
jgi:hypothetical protein